MVLTVLLMLCAVNLLNAQEGDSCTKDGVPGVCTKLKQCPDALQDLLNNKQPQYCWFDIVCCVPLPSARTTAPIPTTTQRTQVSTPSSSNVDMGDMCGPLSLSLSPKPTGQKAWDKCLEYQNKLVFPCLKNDRRGYRRYYRCHHHRRNLLTGGVTAKPNEFPHTGLLGFGSNPADLRWPCAGSLISEKFVLTTAHCTYSGDGGDVKYVQLGILQRSVMPEKDRYRVRRIIKHPEYSPPAKYNDIALLELEKPVPLNEFIVPACVVTGTPVNDSLAVFTGWGNTIKDGKLSDDLKKLVMSKFDAPECAASYPRSRTLKKGIDERTQVCYGDKTTITTTCQGDGGGPLQIKNKQIACMYSVIGVLSFGSFPCGGNPSLYRPDVYTRVTPYVDWIEATVWP